MSKDIFILAKQMAGKQNPIVSALLYDFCPGAAHWYVRGAEPDDVFDVVWKAFEDYATGKNFRAVMDEFGLTTMLPEMRKYIAAVVECRSRYSKDGPSPEITHDLGATFSSQFGLQNQPNHLGGTLAELKHYTRVWRFLMGDWKTCMKMDQKTTSQRLLQLFTVSLSAPGVVQSNLRVHMPVWGWEVRTGQVRRVYLGLLVPNRKQHPLRFALVHGADRADEKKWPNNGRADLWALDRDSGVAEPIIVKSDAILKLIPRWHDEAQAHSASILIERHADAVRAIVEDDGVGFDLRINAGERHFGLLGMQERAELLNGTLTIESGTERGTSIFIEIPLRFLAADGTPTETKSVEQGIPA